MATKAPETRSVKAKSADGNTKRNGKAGAAATAASSSPAVTIEAGPPPSRIAKAQSVKAPVVAGRNKSKPDADNTVAKAKPTAAKARITKSAQPEKVQKAEKPRKAKLIRDSFTMPESEYELLALVKKRCIASGSAVKKSEVLRAAITSFATLSDDAIGMAIAALPPVKTGRPPKEAK